MVNPSPPSPPSPGFYLPAAGCIIDGEITCGAKMGAPKGNQFWKAKSSFGRQPIFKTQAQLWKACAEYFEWVEANPLLEEKIFCAQGKVVRTHLSKMRAMTLGGLCIFLDIQMSTWQTYRIREGFTAVTAMVDETIRNQKFTGAAADMLNAKIIARDLGLADRHEYTGADGGPIQTITSSMTPQEAAEAYADTLRQ